MTSTVLIVEDDQPTQLLLAAVMRRSGVATAVAANGHAAIEIIQARKDIGCVILDLMMPEVDGRAVIAYLAAAEHRIPVIVCTASLPRTTTEFDPDIVRAVLRKPFDIEQLMGTVAAVLESNDQPHP